ncbi:hypothetical protein WBG06_15500 [Nocardioides sp. CCNWLW239]|uniref:hypothetical protein n=1 Tax=Nocardioides sp. CCNWLW239 TaxID=3128902 RepID=UPI003018D4AE
MSRRRSAFIAAVALGVFAFLYSLVLAIPVYIGDIRELWTSRGHAGFGELLGRLVDGFSFLWGSAVTSEGYPVAPASGWPTVVFVVLLVGLVYASARTASESPYFVAGRVLCVGLLVGGLTNLFVVVQTVLGIRGGLASMPTIIWAVPDDGIWLGLVVGVLGGYVALAAAAFAQFAAAALRGGGTVASAGPEAPVDRGWARAARIATWGALPMLVLALVGGFVWDYDPEADPYGADIEPREAWVRLIWFAHARLSGPHNPHSLSGEFATTDWLPRTLSSAVLVVLVWLAMLLIVARWQRVGAPGAVSAVLQLWAVTTVAAAVVGLAEGALVPEEEFAMSARLWALEVAGQAVRFAACFGWLSGVAAVLAHRLSRGAQTDVGEA